LRDRFARAGREALQDYELLELLLFRSIPQRDVKPLAKALLARFGSVAEVLAATPARLAEVPGLGATTALDLKLIEAAGQELTRGAISRRTVLG
jgi:DNA repair protein RadC